MTDGNPGSERFESLDVLRGFAVLGISDHEYPRVRHARRGVFQSRRLEWIGRDRSGGRAAGGPRVLAR